MTRLRIRRSTLVLCVFFLLTLALYLLVRPNTATRAAGSARTPGHSATHSAAPVPPTTTRPTATPSSRHTGSGTPRHTATPSAARSPIPTTSTSSPPLGTPSPTVTVTATPTLP